MRIAILTQRKYEDLALPLIMLGEWAIIFDHESDIFNWEDYDIVVSLLYNKIIKSGFDIPTFGTMNIHPSLLPEHRGSSPNFWAILSGTGAGWTAHKMTAELDRGDIYLQREVPVLLSDTAESLWNRLFDELPSFLSEFAEMVSEGNLEPLDIEQDIEEVNKMIDFHDAHDANKLFEQMDDTRLIQSYSILSLIQACSFEGYEGLVLDTPDGRVEYYARKVS